MRLNSKYCVFFALFSEASFFFAFYGLIEDVCNNRLWSSHFWFNFANMILQLFCAILHSWFYNKNHKREKREQLMCSSGASALASVRAEVPRSICSICGATYGFCQHTIAINVNRPVLINTLSDLGYDSETISRIDANIVLGQSQSSLSSPPSNPNVATINSMIPQTMPIGGTGQSNIENKHSPSTLSPQKTSKFSKVVTNAIFEIEV